MDQYQSTYDEASGPPSPRPHNHPSAWQDPTADAVLSNEWHLATSDREKAYR